jgi:hypothetical protein
MAAATRYFDAATRKIRPVIALARCPPGVKPRLALVSRCPDLGSVSICGGR